MDYECDFQNYFCHFKVLILQNVFSPFTLGTRKNLKSNSEITGVSFDPSCILTFIPNSIFKIFPNLKSLTVSSTQLSFLDPSFFKNANELEEFQCSGNKITKLDAGTFAAAPKLEYIDLHLNQIQDLDHEAFKGLIELKSLDLQTNGINSLAFAVFRPLKKLNKLSLDQNTCTSKNFDNLNGDLTSVEKELEKDSRCSLNDYMTNIRKTQISNQKAIENLRDNANIIKIEMNGNNDDKLEERLKRLEENFQDHEQEMKLRIFSLERTLEKLESLLP